MDSSSYRFPKLKGSSNWEIWVLRATAVLIQKGYGEAMRPSNRSRPTEPPYKNPLELEKEQLKAYQITQEAYQQELKEYERFMANREEQSNQATALIRLMLEDGPLLLTKNCTNSMLLWEQLQGLYQTNGFSSEFLISRDLFSTTLAGCKGSIEDYLNRIRRLTDELATRNLAIPNKVIAAYTLSNLGSEWENTVAIISQTFRSQPGDIDLLALFSQLIDESRRREAI